ncbi:MAG TPA: transglutaminase family protein [Chloroflexota bacterium]|jgi:transglutaminase-like putative cysteine protease|nr:transglutaminase family protein [Chloroflexota bacterium]
MRVSVTHTTRLDYSTDVVEAVMDTRLGPFSDMHQRWDGYEIRAAPGASVRRYNDGFGNAAHLITISRPHRYVEVVTRGEVETLLEDPFSLPAIAPRPLTASEAHDYLSPSSLVPHSEALIELAGAHQPAAPEARFEAVQQLMGWVYRSFSYRKDVTTVATTVTEVLEGRTGVCQDFAHVLIGLCRSIGVPARYVSGYVAVAGTQTTQTQSQTMSADGMSQTQMQPPQGPPQPRGAGASHAWIEAWTPGYGWRGFDPTNNLVASTVHVKMAIGRDYTDIPPTRGTFRGEATERLTVEVAALPLD